MPFDAACVLSRRGRPTAVLASGDPFWHGAGGSLAAQLSPDEWIAHPSPSTFSLAAARLGWPLESTICIGLHAAPFERLVPLLSRGAQIICLVRDAKAAGDLASWLTARGFGASRLWSLSALGGSRESVTEGKAESFTVGDAVSPLALAIEADGAAGLPRVSGLADDLFQHDGQITKRPIRALALSALAPRPGEHLWDIGAGSGSISIEWALAGGNAIAIEVREDRVANIRANAEAFGVMHKVTIITGSAPAALASLDKPEAAFIGGGLDAAMFAAVWPLMPDGTRIVAHGVTLETEALLSDYNRVTAASSCASISPMPCHSVAIDRGRHRARSCSGMLSRKAAHDRAFHRRRPWRARSSHVTRSRSGRLLPGLPLCRLAGACGNPGALSGRRAYRQHCAAVARRDHRGDRESARRGPRCRAAALGRPLGLVDHGRTAASPARARHSLHGHAGRAVIRGGGRRARSRTDAAWPCAIRGADPHLRSRQRHAGGRDACSFCSDRCRACDSSFGACTGQARCRADAVLWRRLPGRRGLARELARREDRARHPRHAAILAWRGARTHRDHPGRPYARSARFRGEPPLRRRLRPPLSAGRRQPSLSGGIRRWRAASSSPRRPPAPARPR